MASEVLDKTVFGLREIFSHLIPGTIILFTALLFSRSIFHIQLVGIPDVFLAILLTFASFVLGVPLDGVSVPFEDRIFRRKFKGPPSSILLSESDQGVPKFLKFPQSFKKDIRRKIHEKFGIPEDADGQHMFDMCYTYIMQNKISDRVEQFLNMYSFARNMIVAMLIESAVLVTWAVLKMRALFPRPVLSSTSTWLFAGALISIVLAYLFYRRFLRYAYSFATEVFRSFYVEQVKPK